MQSKKNPLECYATEAWSIGYTTELYFIGGRKMDMPLEWGGNQGAKTSAIMCGAGTESLPELNSGTDKNWFGYWLKSSGASGTNRGLYMRLYLSGGAGGETIRAYTIVENDTPADTCNGAHLSIGYGSSVGNCTGLATAVRATFHVPNRSLGGTWAPLQAEIYLDGTSAAPGGATSHSLIRAIVDGGNQAAKRKFLNLMEVVCETGAYNAGYMHATTNSGTITEALRIIVNGTVRYIPLIESLVAP
jgi:hypothetical protein